jgi:hypothetical protein
MKIREDGSPIAASLMHVTTGTSLAGITLDKDIVTRYGIAQSTMA